MFGVGDASSEPLVKAQRIKVYRAVRKSRVRRAAPRRLNALGRNTGYLYSLGTFIRMGTTVQEVDRN